MSVLNAYIASGLVILFLILMVFVAKYSFAEHTPYRFRWVRYICRTFLVFCVWTILAAFAYTT